MRVSPQIRFEQQVLFDKYEDLKSLGQKRVQVGKFFENLTALTFGAAKCLCSASFEYCPDLSLNGEYLEVKAMGCSSETIVYAGRLEKDREFVDAGHKLTYVIWHHDVMVGRYRSLNSLRLALLTSIKWVAFVPFDSLEAACALCKTCEFNTAYGGDGVKYRTGYRLPAHRIEPFKRPAGGLGLWSVDVAEVDVESMETPGVDC